MIWVLLIVAQTAAGQSVTTHKFQSREVCIAVKHDLERQLPSARAMCLENPQ
jgi:hypothetical protein